MPIGGNQFGFAVQKQRQAKQQLENTPEGRAALAAPPQQTPDGQTIDPILSLAVQKGLLQMSDLPGYQKDDHGNVSPQPEDVWNSGLKQMLEFGAAATGGAALLGGGAAAAAPAAASAPSAAAAAPGLEAAWGPGELASTTIGSGAVGPIAGVAGTAGLSAAAAAPAAAAAGSGLGGVLSKYGAPVLGGAISSYLAQKNATKQQRQALEVQQSEQDPFRGVMHQTGDLATLAHAMTPPTPYGPRPGSRYGLAAPAQGPIQLSPGYLASLTNASKLIGQGQGQVPDQTDPKNWGNYGTSALTDPTASFTPPARPVSSLIARRLRPRGNANPAAPPSTWNFAAA